MFKKPLIGLLFLATLFANTYFPAYSQNNAEENGINLTLSPTFMNLVTDPGKEVSSQIKITNNNNFEENLEVTVAKFESTDGGEKPLISDMTEGDVHKDWISFGENTFSVGPDETKTIDFTISPPESASLGYYYAVMFSRTNTNAEQPQGATIAGTPAVLVLLDVRSPNAQRKMELVEFKTDSIFYEYLPTTFNITVKNTGNVHISPNGNIFIDSWKEKDIANLPANKGLANVLPNSSRTFSTVWDDGFAVKKPKMQDGKVVTNSQGEVEYEVKYNFSEADNFRFGKYTAHLVMVYNDGEKDVPVEGTVSFWIIPWKILGVSALILILALFGLKSTIFPPLKKLFRRK